MKRKILLMFLICSLGCLVVTGCSSEGVCEICDKGKNCEEYNMGEENIIICEECKNEIYTELLGYEEDVNEINGLVEDTNIDATEEILNASLDSGYVQIGSSVYNIYQTLNNLVLETDAEYGVDPEYSYVFVENENFILTPDDAAVTSLNISDKGNIVTANFVLINSLEQAGPAGNLYVRGILGVEEDSIIFPQGIKVGMTISEIQEIIGVEPKVFEMMDGYLNYSFSVDVKNEDSNVLNTEITSRIKPTFTDDYGFQLIYEFDVDRSTGEVFSMDMEAYYK